jgi:hypothetical protein
MAALFRRFGEASGLEFGPRMEELMSRLAAGEDPDQLEEQLGEGLDDDDAMAEFFRLRRQGWKLGRRPEVDDQLYFL